MTEAMSYGPPVISVDVEDWPQSTWDRNLPITDRAVDNTRRLLRLLREAEVPVTKWRATAMGIWKWLSSPPTNFWPMYVVRRTSWNKSPGRRLRAIVRLIFRLSGVRSGLLMRLWKPILSMTPAS